MDTTQAGIWRNLIKTFGNNPLNTRMVESAQGLIGGTPIAGDIQSGLLAANDLRKGNYGDAALNGIGLLPFVPSMAGIIGGYGKKANELAQLLNEAHPNIDADLMGDTNVVLSKIIAKNKGNGDGTRFMQDLANQADSNGVRVDLSPSSDFGGNKNRLTEFYKRFGFVENKGRNKDFSISESMYRNHKE